jgi:hypothetical protein
MFNKRNNVFSILYLVIGVIIFSPSLSYAQCTNPASPAGGIAYDSAGDFLSLLACDGTDWVPWAGWTISGYPAPQYSSSGASILDDLGDVDTTGKNTNDVLTWDGSSWGAAAGGGGGTPAGATSQIQFNSNGAFDATPHLYWNDSKNRITVDGTAGDVPGVEIIRGNFYWAMYGTNSDQLGFGVWDNGGSSWTDILYFKSTGDAYIPSGNLAIGPGWDSSYPLTVQHNYTDAPGNVRYLGYMYGDQTVADGTGGLTALVTQPRFTATGTLSQLYGGEFQPRNMSSGTVANMQGVRGLPVTDPASSGNVTTMIGVLSGGTHAGSGTITNMAGVTASPHKDGTGPITNMQGLYVQLQNNNATGAVANGYGLYIDTPVTTGAITNNFGVYQTDENAINYFNGRVGVGVNNPYADARMQIAETFTTASWKEGLDIYVAQNGDAGASYNGVVGLKATAETSVTGTGGPESWALFGSARTTDDASSQNAFSLVGQLRTFAGDTGRGVDIRDDDASTGGTQYGVYINLNDTDVTRYGLYQVSSNKNYLAGNLGINDNDPTVALDVGGDIHYTGQLVDVSDIRLKENVRPLQSPLAKLTSLHGFAFEMKDDPKHVTEYGVSAQDVQKVFPELVSVVDPENGTLGVNYNGLIAPMIEALKAQQVQIEELQAEIRALKEERQDTKNTKQDGEL